ncbi:hypothetical protein Q9L58_006229 [Maublancomyces gigas]|uniref:Uncharacterized protein n=1 Tax=Discina gigas TaxID=1032678 RepID=A0ABR3GFY3_9PEZI
MAIDATPPPFAESSDKFREDDLEFRTITTLLYLLGSHNQRGSDTSPVRRRTDRYLKLLPSVPSMLVMNREVIAIMPKRSATGLTLFICPEPVPDMDGVDAADGEESEKDRISDSVTLMKIPVVNIGDNIFEFIVCNWDQPFEAHAQAIARLIGACKPGDKSWVRLANYSLFQSAPKAARRFATDVFFELLTSLPAANGEYNVPADFPDLTELDKEHLRSLFAFADDDLADRFRFLKQFLYRDDSHISDNPRPFLQDLHGFFVLHLCEVKRNFDALKDLRGGKTPPSVRTLAHAVQRARGVVEDLHHFVWNSEFFKWYITVYQRQAISARYIELTRPKSPALEHEQDIPGEGLADDIQRTVNEDADDEDQDNEAEIADFAPDFEMTGDLLHPLDGPADKIYSWLRVVTSTFHHTLRFKRTMPDAALNLDFQVIKYPISDGMMKDWQETVAELAGDAKTEKEIINVLSSKADGNRKFTPFRPGSTLKFNGRAHCEAVLGCLHSLAKRGQDISWTGVSQDIVDIFKKTYSIVAPSKRCCPICATLIAALSREDGAPELHTLTKHTHIFPTAFPYGLPERIRHQLLVEYKDRLRSALHGLVAKHRTASGMSLQSEALSAGSGDEADPPSKLEEMKREKTELWVELWLGNDEPSRMEKWFILGLKSPEERARYRVELVSQGDVWNGLRVPSYIFE